MLSLEECRRILGDDAPATESELEAHREFAYSLARLVAEIYEGGVRNSTSAAPKDTDL